MADDGYDPNQRSNLRLAAVSLAPGERNEPVAACRPGRCLAAPCQFSRIGPGQSKPRHDLRTERSARGPLRDRNDLLLAAGFAPTYRRTSLEAPEMAPVREALARILVAHEPYPAIVFDRLYDIVQANRAARRLIAFLFAERAPDPTIAGNVLRSVLHPQGCRGAMENWDDLAAILLRRLRAEALAAAPDDPLRALLEEVTGYDGIPQNWRGRTDLDWRQPMLTVAFARGSVSFGMFSTIATLGAPFDITLQDIRIESYFPIDDRAATFFQSDR